MRIHIHTNLTRKHAYEVTSQVYRQLCALGAEITMSYEIKEHFCDFNVTFLDEDTAVSLCDVVVAIGGDGTIISASQSAAIYDKPILGINAGRLGFLAGLEKQELHLLKNLFDGNYTTDKRMMLKVIHHSENGAENEFYCLNDCIIARGTSLKLCEIEASYNKGKINNFVSDGIIVATPTGSTAYSLSAGGPVVDTAIESLILTPVCPHSLFTRSMIFQADSVIRLKVTNNDTSLPVFSCDGKTGVSLSENDYLEIKKADRSTKLIKIKSDSFADIFSQKLIERYSDVKEETI